MIAPLLLAAAAATFDLRLPSPEGTGSPVGTLAVRVVLPAAGDTLFPSGAPVVVEVPGGDGTGGLTPPPFSFHRVAYVSFLLPGGRQGDLRSDGTYDRRGPACIAALADVLRFAGGQAADTQSRTIRDLSTTPVLTDNVGVLALSNGGTLGVVTLALHGPALGWVRWLVGWENPSSGQLVTTDAGPGENLACPGAPPKERPRPVNPGYRGFADGVVDIDYSHIAYDPVADALFLDGNGNGTYDTVTRPDGCRLPDLDLDGELEADEDFRLGSRFDEPSGRRHHSLQAVRAVADVGLFDGAWPAWLDTPEESIAFWWLRDEAEHVETLGQLRPDLDVILVASVADHVQTPADHPHIWQVHEPLRRAGVWVRLNPGRASVVEVEPSLAGRTDLPDNLPSSEPERWDDPSIYAPEGIPDPILQAAAVEELARRTAAKDLEPAPRVRRRLGR